MSKVAIEAVADKIMVEYLRKTSTSAGLLIPDMAQDPQGYGKVLSVGDLITNTPIKEGDILVFHTRAGMDLIHDKKVLKCIKIEEVWGILHDEDLVKRLEPLEFKGKSDRKSVV